MKANPSLLLLLALLSSTISNADVVSELTGRAEKGDAVAQMELAGIYAKGEGVAKDQAAAAQWILKAAEQGDVQAQVLLGQRYLKGAGVSLDDVEAYKWSDLAAAQGDAGAKKIISVLTLRMTREQIEFGKQLARDHLDMKKAEKTMELPTDIPQVLPTQLPVEPE